MIMVLTCIFAISIEYVYWFYIPHALLLQLLAWTKPGTMVYTNDRIYMLGPWHSSGPSFPAEEGRTLNISLGVKILYLCIICHKQFLRPKSQLWVYNVCKRLLLGLFGALTFIFQKKSDFVIQSETYIIGWLNEPVCETITWKYYIISDTYWSTFRG